MNKAFKMTNGAFGVKPARALALDSLESVNDYALYRTPKHLRSNSLPDQTKLLFGSGSPLKFFAEKCMKE